jgi:hypothetical protein
MTKDFMASFIRSSGKLKNKENHSIKHGKRYDVNSEKSKSKASEHMERFSNSPVDRDMKSNVTDIAYHIQQIGNNLKCGNFDSLPCVC